MNYRKSQKNDLSQNSYFVKINSQKRTIYLLFYKKGKNKGEKLCFI
ncbi:hypothetical protein HMPREF9996_01860 [Aggregatibacter actinomycetemcomitans Y4]|nr:hypothetical protein ANH9381_0057 [Aggregatibacter actinomycetemcomitans ANH9381]AHN72913.1 hypothetical protein CF65_02890 [Aggregatibacter actinomycetemcomitans HK1651]EKX94429.1 hypothetical protein HMPREF9996_01860 [Aggregatibacter actinomycetemcomitans Y4]